MVVLERGLMFDPVDEESAARHSPAHAPLCQQYNNGREANGGRLGGEKIRPPCRVGRSPKVPSPRLGGLEPARILALASANQPAPPLLLVNSLSLQILSATPSRLGCAIGSRVTAGFGGDRVGGVCFLSAKGEKASRWTSKQLEAMWRAEIEG